MLTSLLAPLRLPERVIETLESLAGAARELGPIRIELTRVREQTEPVAELLPALKRLEQELTRRLDGLHDVVMSLEGDESHLNVTVRKLVEELEGLHGTVGGLQGDVERITDRLPDPDEKRGPLEAARDVLSGSGN